MNPSDAAEAAAASSASTSTIPSVEPLSISPPPPQQFPESGAVMSLEERFALLRSIGEECIGEDELRRLLEEKPVPVCYDGFEPSGRMHIAEGIVKTINVNKMVKAGCKVKIWIADWFALLNDKMGGDLKKIQTVGRYMVEIWKAAGMDLNGVEFLWSSNEINTRADEYWPLVIDIARRNNVKRIMRCCTIMGRSEQDELSAAQILYPCMQCADVFFLKADICQMGMDQREVNMLAREYCDDIKRKNKPIILSHHMLPGLLEGQEKMSKSDSSSAIFMEDEEAEVNVKIKKAYCPPKVVEGNPCLAYIEYIVFPWFGKFEVVRKEENGGDKTFRSMDELIADYESGALHPADLKPALIKALNQILQPVRDHFKNNSEAKDLLKTVKINVASRGNRSNGGRGNMGQRNKQLFMASVIPSVEPLSISPPPPPPPQSPESGAVMSLEERFALLRSIGEECIQEDELWRLLEKKLVPVCYDGFEPSGRMHIAQGIVKTINVNKMVKAGCKVKIWIADWFAQLNNKMGGDLRKIQTVGRYMVEIWKAAGMDLNGVEFLWSSTEINARAGEYWPLVIDIARRNNIKRIMRCCTIMGRSEQDELSAAQILYPCMQCADIFFLKADICQLGMDQRKVNMLAREYCDDIKRKNKPIILSHHMLPGLLEGQEKMSKSDPSSAIFMEDEEAEVNVKINKAYCPPKLVEGNPCLEYVTYIVFPWFGKFEVVRKEENGGDKTFRSMDELIAYYESGALHPADLKPALIKALNQILQPVRDHFKNNSEAKDLLKTVKQYRVTR